MLGMRGAIERGIAQGMQSGLRKAMINICLEANGFLPASLESLMRQMPFNGYHCERCRYDIEALRDQGYCVTASWIFFDRHSLTQKGLDYLNSRPAPPQA